MALSPRRLGPAALVAAAALAPLAFSANAGILNDMVVAAAYAVMALGLNVVVGYAGLLDLGYVAFYAIGAYTAAYLASGFWANAGGGQGVAVLVAERVAQLPGIHVNFVLVFLAAVLATTVAGALIGVPTLRLRGDYVAIVTLAFGEIVGSIAANGGEIGLFGGKLTSGPIGIGPIDNIDLPLLERFSDAEVRPWYWFALALVVAVVVVSVHLRRSRIGRAWVALRDDEGAAAAAGVPIARMKLLAYATGAAFGGLSGAFLASYFSVVNARQFEYSFSIFVFAMVVVGGVGSIPGVIAGAVLLSAIDGYLLPDVLNAVPDVLGLGFDLATVSSGVYGAILLVLVLLWPNGVGGARLPASFWDRRRFVSS